jgi:hypothetical protein
MDEGGVKTIDMDRIVELVVAHGVTAFVDQTGGGTATIYAGLTHADAAGDLRYAACAGPGEYGWGARPSTAIVEEFYVGLDDDGESDAVDVNDVGAHDEAAIADLIIHQAIRLSDTPVPLSFDEIEQLGFDATGRSSR